MLTYADVRFRNSITAAAVAPVAARTHARTSASAGPHTPRQVSRPPGGGDPALLVFPSAARRSGESVSICTFVLVKQVNCVPATGAARRGPRAHSPKRVRAHRVGSRALASLSRARRSGGPGWRGLVSSIEV